MKKIIMVLIALVMIAVGSIYMNYQQQNEEAKQKLFHRAKDKMERFIKANYEGIHTVTFEDKVDITPMGGIFVYGYYNDDPENELDGLYDKANDEIMGHTIDAVRKKECRDKDCNY